MFKIFIDSLEDSQAIPTPFCYVPNIDQINSYKQYKKVFECRGASSNIADRRSLNDVSCSSTSPHPGSSEDRHTLLNALRQSQSGNATGASQGHLMTIQEFLMAASPDSIFQEFLNSSRSDTNSENRENAAAFNRLRLLSTHDGRASANSDTPDSDNIVNNTPERGGDSFNTQSVPNSRTRPKHVVEYTDYDCELQGKVSKDIWEHLCSDRLWETVVDYYYSVCATSKERKEECFNLKGIEIVHPAVARLADVLLFKMSKNKSKQKKSGSDQQGKAMNVSLNTSNGSNTEESVLNYSNDMDVGTTSNIAEDCKKERETSEVKTVLNEMIEKVCADTEDERQLANTSSESLDSVVMLPSFQVNSEESLLSDTSFDTKSEKDDTQTTNSKFKNRRRGKSSRYVDIKTDNKTGECISKIQNAKWTHQHDLELISFLSSLGKDTESNTLVRLSLIIVCCITSFV